LGPNRHPPFQGFLSNHYIALKKMDRQRQAQPLDIRAAKIPDADNPVEYFFDYQTVQSQLSEKSARN
jgi:hypothetical protein